MKHTKKLISLLLALALTAGILAVCGTASAYHEKLAEKSALTAMQALTGAPVTQQKAQPTRCPVCYEYGCDDGIFCDDADEKAENLREEENRKNGTPCPVCADYDCDDGRYCDDAHERQENLWEEAQRQAAASAAPAVPAPTEPAAPSLCPICYDNDCDDGRFCDDWDDRAENLREQENRKNGTPCPVCADYDCDDGQYCDDWDEREENLREEAQRQAAASAAPAVPAPTEPAAPGLCPICYDNDCDDGRFCDDWDDRAENLREQENRKNGTPCPICREYDCDDGPRCDG